MEDVLSQEISLMCTVTQGVADDSMNNQSCSQNFSKNQRTLSKRIISFPQFQQKTLIGNEQNKNCSMNFSEKIIFIIDTACESTATQFQLGTGAKYCSLYMIKRVVEIFTHNKLMLNPKHEFALIILDSQKAHWLCNFTGDLKLLLSKLELIEESSINEDQKFFDIQDAFKLVYHHVICDTLLLKNNVVRIILIYCRSYVLPRFNTTEFVVQELINNPNFFLDVLYVHELPSLENKCEEIYVELTKLDIKNISYIMEVARSAVKIHNYMARLLAHPLQRVPQKDIKYCIHPLIMKQIEQTKSNI